MNHTPRAASRHLLLAICLLAVLALAQPAQASSIVYTITGTMTGTLGSSPFANATFTWTVNADTTGVSQPSHPQQYRNTGTSSSISISGLPGATFSTPIGVQADQRAGHGDFLVGDAAQADEAIGISDPTDVDAWSPALASSFGPVTSAGVLVLTIAPLPTSQGNLNITAVGNLTVQASFPPPNGPIPSSALLGLTGLACLGLYQWGRSRRRGLRLSL